jgi:hypothetical protein
VTSGLLQISLIKSNSILKNISVLQTILLLGDEAIDTRRDLSQEEYKMPLLAILSNFFDAYLLP